MSVNGTGSLIIARGPSREDSFLQQLGEVRQACPFQLLVYFNGERSASSLLIALRATSQWLVAGACRTSEMWVVMLFSCVQNCIQSHADKSRSVTEHERSNLLLGLILVVSRTLSKQPWKDLEFFKISTTKDSYVPRSSVPLGCYCSFMVACWVSKTRQGSKQAVNLFQILSCSVTNRFFWTTTVPSE